MFRFHSLGLGDENVAGSKYGSMEADFEKWSTLFVQRVEKWNGVGVCKEGKADAGDAGGQKTSDFDTSEDEGEEESSPDVSDNDEEEDDLVDLEDLGKVKYAPNYLEHRKCIKIDLKCLTIVFNCLHSLEYLFMVDLNVKNTRMGTHKGQNS